MSLLLKNGKRVIEGNTLQAVDVFIAEGMIADMGDRLDVDADTVIDLKGQLIHGGLVDVHVHLREPGQTEKETIKTGSQAAARGGFTTICAMPNTIPVPDTAAKYQDILAIIERDAVVHVHQYAPITSGLRSEDIIDMKAIDAFAYTNDGVGVQTAQTMYLAMKAAQQANKPIVAHTEDDSLLFGGVMHEGIRNRQLGLPGMLELSESTQIARDILLAKATGAHYHVCHVSSANSVSAIRWGKGMGVRVSAEVSPHHLILNEMDIPGDDGLYKMNPPLRSLQDQQALIDGLMDGTIDIIATDHAPHTASEKSQGFAGSPFGITGSEIAFALIYTYFVRKNRFILEDVLAWMSSKPQALFDIKGSQLAIGQPADIAVFDLDRATVINADDFKSKSTNTPFIGKKLWGMCTLTVVQGAIVWNDI